MPGNDPEHNTNLPAVRPVTITADPVEVRTRQPRWRTITSGTPIVGGITPAPEGMSWPDRVMRRIVIEAARTFLWVVAGVLFVVVNTGGAVWWVGRRVWRLPRRRRHQVTRPALSAEIARLAVQCDECGAVAARPAGSKSVPGGWFYSVIRGQMLCPVCLRPLVEEARRSWTGEGQ